MGMSVDEFYRGHTWLTVSYKRAYRIRREQENFDKWLIGAYIYEAMQRNAPLFNAFSKAKPEPYLERPYDLYSCGDSEGNIREEGNGGNKKAIAFMQGYMARHNAAMDAKRAMGEVDPDQAEDNTSEVRKS